MSESPTRPTTINNYGNETIQTNTQSPTRIASEKYVQIEDKITRRQKRWEPVRDLLHQATKNKLRWDGTHTDPFEADDDIFRGPKTALPEVKYSTSKSPNTHQPRKDGLSISTQTTPMLNSRCRSRGDSNKMYSVPNLHRQIPPLTTPKSSPNSESSSPVASTPLSRKASNNSTNGKTVQPGKQNRNITEPHLGHPNLSLVLGRNADEYTETPKNRYPARMREQARIGSMRKADKLAALRQKRQEAGASDTGGVDSEQIPQHQHSTTHSMLQSTPTGQAKHKEQPKTKEDYLDDEAFFNNSAFDVLLHEIYPSNSPTQPPQHISNNMSPSSHGTTQQQMTTPTVSRTSGEDALPSPLPTTSTKAKGYQFPSADSPLSTTPEFTINIPRTNLTNPPSTVDRTRHEKKKSRRRTNSLKNMGPIPLAASLQPEISALMAENSQMRNELGTMQNTLKTLSKLVLASCAANEAEIKELRRHISALDTPKTPLDQSPPMST
ncbi:hypothetical protein H4219_000200 [Mycoemilia scoparia]|uniref:Uncharacterized protein n=1 Tax=Mycoemilia scoparia TaxID=417184 RepID=A0A9W8ABU7_9FUNG|nr:hypothetical protein H4219_000200 [Mycoemilia scoparia]